LLEARMMRKTFGPVANDARGGWKKLFVEKLHN
jgi:hypothetical protein